MLCGEIWVRGMLNCLVLVILVYLVGIGFGYRVVIDMFVLCSFFCMVLENVSIKVLVVEYMVI